MLRERENQLGKTLAETFVSKGLAGKNDDVAINSRRFQSRDLGLIGLGETTD